MNEIFFVAYLYFDFQIGQKLLELVKSITEFLFFFASNYKQL